MQKKVLVAAMFALSIAAGAALAEEVSQHPYENGGYYSGQTWNPVAAMAAMPAMGMQMATQAMNTAMQPMTAPYKGHQYRNGGYFGEANSDIVVESSSRR